MTKRINGLPAWAGRSARTGTTRLRELHDFGPNHGRLDAWFFVPSRSPAQPRPLVVVLHGCTQTAQGYDNGSGWSELAEAHDFAVLFPEQRRSNNANLCFNWFEPADTRRGDGEASTIAQMIDTMIASHGIDAERVFITGLSAGGAMTSAMLAAYPEKFAGGAILAGLPHGAATSVQEAFQQMRAHTPTRRTSGRSIGEASPHRGDWPTVSIWHGTADSVVDQSNADAIVRQWREVHGLPEAPSEAGLADGHPHRAWRDGSGKLLIEEYRVTGMGHGTPLATAGECGCGRAGAFMLEVGISSTLHSARTWGLLGERQAAQERVAPGRAVAIDPPVAPAAPVPAVMAVHRAFLPPVTLPARGRVGQVIEDALRSAGLMK
ncbi:MAG TPA: PHB depolymerase family esterase [Croceibacterium sp.]